METKQVNSNWEGKPQVKKGNIGEAIVRNHLEKEGWIIYEPVTNSAHLSDKFAVRDKREIMIAEVKTKAKLNYYDGTGFDFKNYQEYRNITSFYGIGVFVFFVDESPAEKRIYGNLLSELEKPCEHKGIKYPKRLTDSRNGKELIIFPMCHMKTIQKLTDSQVEGIKKYNTRNYDYEQSTI